jgi:hypothetical protein
MAHAHQKQVDENFNVFTQLLPQLLQSHPGKHAVLHDGEVVEFFDTLHDAVKYGHAKFGDLNFSVQKITDQDVNLGAHSYAVCEHTD